MRFDRELACDAAVLALVPDGERRQYGRTLIGILERFSHTQHMPAVAGLLENGTQLKRRLTMITKFQPPTRLADIWAVILIAVLSGTMLTQASGESGKTGNSADEPAAELTLAEQNVKYVTRYTIIFSNGLRLETYLPSHLSPAITGGFALQKVFTQIVDPVYPEAARAAGVSGQVVFLVTLDKDGSIIRAIRRMGNPILADAAATAMRQWKASPQPASISSVTFPIEFVFRPNGTVDTAQTAPTLGAGKINQNELDPYPGGFPKPEDFLIGEPPNGLAALSREAAPQFVPATPMDR
jgi:TonB family protein